jgi:beta-glucosidase/6-phospho-beta-glucosidase/beta-galactosidase
MRITLVDLQASACSPVAPSIPFMIGFESTYLPGHDVDVAEKTAHIVHWKQDIELATSAGVRRMRYPLRWHRIEPEPGVYDFSETDAALSYLAEQSISPVVDLIHHTSYPQWLDDGFRDRRFGPAYVRFCEAVAQRYPWLSEYTLFNEPFATLFLAGHEGLWPPYDRGIAGFVRLLRNVLPALHTAADCWAQLLPQAQHVWIDTCEHHRGTPGAGARQADLANDRRHVVLDLALGQNLDPERPFVSALLAAGGEDLLNLEPIRVDLLGLDYYCHSEWWYDDRGARAPSPHPSGFAAIAGHYADRYDKPVFLAETNIRGLASDRTSWLRYMLEQCEVAASQGTPIQGFCWFPFVDSTDWDSLLARPAGRTDPVGVYGRDDTGGRLRTSFTSAWDAVATGVAVEAIPAYRFQSPCREQLAGFLPQMQHWPWQDPPAPDRISAVHIGRPPTAAAYNSDPTYHSNPTERMK